MKKVIASWELKERKKKMDKKEVIKVFEYVLKMLVCPFWALLEGNEEDEDDK